MVNQNQDEVRDALEEIADVAIEALESEPDHDQLPVFDGYQMVKEWDPAFTGKVYRDEEGDVWIYTDGSGEDLCLGTETQAFIDAIQEARTDE